MSPTGSGKTLAYLLPLLLTLKTDDGSVQVLILVPSRELALQIDSRIPLAGEGCARKTQEGETGEVPPMEISATERKGVCGKPKRGVPHH